MKWYVFVCLVPVSMFVLALLGFIAVFVVALLMLELILSVINPLGYVKEYNKKSLDLARYAHSRPYSIFGRDEPGQCN